eukprot:4674848-Karenia_brevis.AAC.1
MVRSLGNVEMAERLSRRDVEVRAPREDEEIARGLKRDMESSSDSERSIGVRSHDDPPVIARRKRMGMRDNKFNDEEEDEEDGGRESSSSTPLQPESRP